MSTPEQMEILYNTVFQIDDDELIIALLQQDLNTIENYNLLTVEDITRACGNIKRPGGTIVDADGDLVPNRGQQVSAVLEKRLKQFG
jgi:hypothetical protein